MTAASTPKLDRTMKLADGRMLAFSEWGDLDGRPVALLHGMPGSRLMCPDTEATETAGVRLITIDRPGYGRSDPRPDRTLLNWVDDYVELADHLRLDACPVVGWASGGMYALACAYRLGDRVPAVAVAGSPGPTREVPGAMADLSPEGRALVELLQRDRAVGIEAISRSVEAGDGEGLHVPLRFRASPATDRVGRTRIHAEFGRC